MEYRQLGTSSLRVSSIAFGGMSLPPDDPESIALLREALDHGINFFDTADLYNKGLNEELLGAAFADRRKDCIIATKVGNEWKEDGSGWDWNPRKEYIITAVEKSLRRLKTDYIDLYQLHGGTMEDPIDDTIAAFELLQQQGKIRYYGISSIRPVVIREWLKRSSIQSVMMQYSLLDRRPEETCMDLLAQNQVGLLARGALAKGLLAGKPAGPFLNYDAVAVKKMAAAVRELTNANETPVAIALRYILQQPAVTAAVVGIRTRQQLEEALQAAAHNDLTPEQLSFLQNQLPPNFYTEHR